MTFGAESTTDDVLDGVDLTGRLALVTGSSGGLGAETARALAARNATVVMAARNGEKNAAAADAIRSAHRGASVEVLDLDLSSLASVRAAANEFLERHDRLDLLVNNAGVMCTPKGTTADGFETQFGTNHLGHFLFTHLLTPSLLNGAPARVVNLSSGGHAICDVDLDDPGFENAPYNGWVSYGRSKSANIHFTAELDRRLRADGVRSFAVHPGMIATDLGRHMTDEDRAFMTARAQRSAPQGDTAPLRSMFKSIPQGAATTVWAATSAELDGVGGLYLEDCSIAAAKTSPDQRGGYAAHADNPDVAGRLWQLSERLVGLTS